MTSTIIPPARPAAPDWRLAIPEPRRRVLRGWFWSIAAVTLCVLIVGGVTRLTRSGLSIVDWDPIMGVIPPLNDVQWQNAFDAYRQFPEYRKLRQGMTLGEFQFIYFWEYLHRLLARMIGLVFLLPFLFFAVRQWFNRPLAARSLALFALGAGQGLMGWLMVASGLVDRPSVSHYRLAAHLSLAFIIFCSAVWLARELAVQPHRDVLDERRRRRLRTGVATLGVLLGLQVVWGAFVAGLKAGFFMNTFPLMAGGLVPPGFLAMSPAVLNFLENPATVQWTHRLLGTVLLIAALVVAARVTRATADGRSRTFALAFAGMVAAQYALGVLTLVTVVPVALGVMHQVFALVLFGVWTAWLHHTRLLMRAPSDALD